MSKFFSEKFNNLTPYVPGEQPKGEFIKLNANESPYAPSPLGVELACEEAGKVNLYPDATLSALKETYATYLGVKPTEVIATNGSDDVLNFAFNAFCDNKTPAVFADITYGFYEVFAKLNGVKAKIIPLKSDFTIDVEAFKNAGGTIFLANPNAPTGISLSLAKVEEIIKANPNNVVVVDEAYVDFGGESAVKLINKYENLLVTQTFSKSRSLAGARLGFGIACEKLILDLETIRYSTNPYNINKMTMAMGIGSILDDGYFKTNCQKIIETRQFFVKKLEGLGFETLPSSTNFILTKNKKISGCELFKKIKENGILVRHFNSPRVRDYVRITIGEFVDMQKLFTVIEKIMEENSL